MRISTIIPAYNRAGLIGETLRSVLSQTRPPHEVIVVDDGSSDGTPDVVAGFGRAVTLIRQANAGAGPARNVGFARSCGEIVHFMDSDDLCSLNFYEEGASRLARGADMTYGPWLKARFDGTRIFPEPFVLHQRPAPAQRSMDILALLVEWVTVFQPCLLHRRLFERAGPFRNDLEIGEDIELMYRILQLGINARHVPEALVLYRVHPENQLSERGPSRTLQGLAALWEVLEQHANGRADLDAATRRKFRRKKLDIAYDLSKFDPARAAAMNAHAGTLELAMRPWFRFAKRGRSKLRDWIAGTRYPSILSPARLREDQRALIEALGYALA